MNHTNNRNALIVAAAFIGAVGGAAFMRAHDAPDASTVSGTATIRSLRTELKKVHDLAMAAAKPCPPPPPAVECPAPAPQETCKAKTAPTHTKKKPAPKKKPKLKSPQKNPPIPNFS